MDPDDSDEKDSDDDQEDPRRKRRFCNERDDLPACVIKNDSRTTSAREKFSNHHKHKNHIIKKIEIVKNSTRKNFHHEKSKPIPTLAVTNNNNLITIRSNSANVQQSSNNHNNKFRIHPRVPHTNQYNVTHSSVQHFNPINSGFNGSQNSLYPVSAQSSSGATILATPPKIHVNPHFVKKFLKKSNNSESPDNEDADLSSVPFEAIHLAAAVVAANIVSANKLIKRPEPSCNNSVLSNTQDNSELIIPSTDVSLGLSKPLPQCSTSNNEPESDHLENGGQPIPVIGGSSTTTVYNNNPSAIHFKRRQNACHPHSLYPKFNQQYNDHQRFHLSKIPTYNFDPLTNQLHASSSYGTMNSISSDTSQRSLHCGKNKERFCSNQPSSSKVVESCLPIEGVSETQQMLYDDNKCEFPCQSHSESEDKQKESINDT